MIDLWTKLQKTNRSIVIYGMGNGADKIANELERRGLKVAAYFASDEFVRGQSFRGHRVMTFDEVKTRFKDFVILVAFASQLRSVMDTIYTLNDAYELYVPDVPVVGENVFDIDFFNANKSFISEARELLADEESKRIYDSVLAYKLTGELAYLKEAVSSKDEVYMNILSCERYRTCADLGAYNGDSVREFVETFLHVERIVSLEPDRRNYKKLCRFVEDAGLSFVECHNCAAWKENGEIAFSESGNRNARAGDGNGKVAVRTLDGILKGERVDYIKYDVEGSEYEALTGSLRTIRHYTPDLLVSLYHRNEDIFRLPLFLHSLDSGYQFYLRRFEYIPAWDLNLYAVKR